MSTMNKSSFRARSVGAFCALIVLIALGVGLTTGSSHAQGQNVIINEIMASNLSSIADGDGDNSDWIELYNPTGAAIDIGGWQISDDLATYTIPSGQPAVTTIPAGGYLIIWASDKNNPLDPTFPGPAGEIHTDFKISSIGETVTLTQPGVGVVDSVTYPSIVSDTTYGTDGFGGYVVFAFADTTPGAQNTAVAPTPTSTPPPQQGPASIVFNEVMANNETTIFDEDAEPSDWIELYNPTCGSIDLSGWILADSIQGWPIPAGTVLAPGETVFFWASDKGNLVPPPSMFHTTFKVSSLGETLSLIDPAGLLIDQVTTPAANIDESYGLNGSDVYQSWFGGQITPDALNPGQTVPFCPTPTPTATPSVTPTPATPTVTPTAPPTVTPGGPTLTPTPTPTPSVTPSSTATPSSSPTPLSTSTPLPSSTAGPATATPTAACVSPILINELMPRNNATILDGDGDNSDWIELYNPATTAQDLTNWAVSDSTTIWSFPSGTTVPAEGFLLVFASDKGDPSNPDYPGPSGELHTNFKLSGSGEFVVLFDASVCEIDRVTYPAMEQNQSWGLLVDQSRYGVFLWSEWTPGAPNAIVAPVGECFAPDAGVRISRIVAKNDGVLLDGDGDDSDFIEVEYVGFGSTDLDAWMISDDNDTFILPVGIVLVPGEPFTIWASGKGDPDDVDYPGPPGEVHTDFKLSSDGETVTLAEPSSCVADRTSYPALGDNDAWTLAADGQRVVLSGIAPTAPCATPGIVRLVAIQAKNDTTRADEDGDFGDWIEISSTLDEVVDLSGWVLADSETEWVFPDGVTLPADSELLIWADEKDRGSASEALHSNFKLSGDGERVTIGSSSGCPVDAVSYPVLDDDQILVLDDDGLYSVRGATAPKQESKNDSGDDNDSATSIDIVATCISINEVMAKNDSTLEDGDGEFGDWIELANLGDDTIDLSGWEIADEETTWVIPDDVEIEAGGFLVIWADETDTGDADSELHTNFKLGGGGEPITVTDSDGGIAASISGYPELDDDEAFGVIDDDTYGLIEAGDATPGDGPVATSSCDYELAYGSENAEAASDDDDESGDGTAGGDADAASAVAASASESGASESGASEDALAVTGSNSNSPTVLAQLLLYLGAAMVVGGAIVDRRARLL